MDKNIGAMLDGRYEIQKRIGVGGMADVYKAIDVIESREVAVKILKNEFINNDEFLQRFKNESKAVSMLSHPNIVKVLDVGFNEDVRFIVMEYIDGITLKDYIEREKKLTWKEASHLIVQILRALQHAHDRGIIHRDIKPQNIMMFEDGTIKVMDFGIAKFTYEMGITATAQTIGSVHYISPEQACGKTTDGKSDIYSVGIILYEMLTGQKPFDTDNPLTVALMQMNDTPRMPREINPDIPEGMEEIILKAMEKEGSDRYHSANEMIKDIELFKTHPEMTFGYTFKSVNNNSSAEQEPDNGKQQEEHEEDKDYLDYDPDEVSYYIGNKKKNEPERPVMDMNFEYETPGSSVLTKVATVATVVVMVGIVALIAGFISKAVKGEKDTTFPMPNLIRYNYDDMVKKYNGKLILKIDGEPVYSEYVENTIVSQSIDKGTVVDEGTEVLVQVSNGKNIQVVPEVDGLTSTEAVNLITKYFKVVQTHLFNETVPYDHVIRVSPAAGTELEINSEVTIYISKGAQNDQKILPNVVGKQKDEAVKMIESAGFTVDVEEKDDKAPAGEVISQNFPGDTLVNPTEKIILVVSTGKVPEEEISMTVDFPDRSTGVVTFKIYIEDKLVKTIEDINIEGFTYYIFEVSGSDKHTVKIEVTNIVDNSTALMGTYTFDFNEKKYEIVKEDVAAALQAIGALKPIETTVVTTVPSTPPPTHPATSPVTTVAPPTQTTVPTEPSEPETQESSSSEPEVSESISHEDSSGDSSESAT